MSRSQEVNVTIKKNFVSAMRGCIKCSRLRKKFGGENTKIIILPDYDEEILYYALIYLQSYLDMNDYDDAIIVAMNRDIEKACKAITYKVKAVVQITEEQMNDIVQAATIINLGEDVCIASIDKPIERYGSRFIGIRGADKESVFVLGVYKFMLNEAMPWNISTSKELQAYKIFNEMIKHVSGYGGLDV